MTTLDVSFHFELMPGVAEMQALNSVREVYGVRAIQIDEKSRTMRVEFDASRLSEDQVESLLRRAGLDLTEKISLVG